MWLQKKTLKKKHCQVGSFCKNSTSWVFTQNIPSKNLHDFFYIIYNLRNIFHFINNIYLKYIGKKTTNILQARQYLNSLIRNCRIIDRRSFLRRYTVLNHKLHVSNYGDVSIWVNKQDEVLFHKFDVISVYCWQHVFCF